MLAMILLVAAIASGDARKATPIGNLASRFGPQNYPAEAIDAGESGRVGVNLTIATDGSVSGCQLLVSSGSSSLDEATCRLAREQLQFTPATDALGSTVADSYRLSVNWQLPKTTIDRIDSISFRLKSGAVTSCFLTSDHSEQTKSECEAAAPSPAVLARYYGDSFIDITQLELVVTRRGGDAPIKHSSVNGRRALIAEVVFSIGADGLVNGCEARPVTLIRTEPCSIEPNLNIIFDGAKSFVVGSELIADLPPNPPSK